MEFQDDQNGYCMWKVLEKLQIIDIQHSSFNLIGALDVEREREYELLHLK
jgi:hypothetical protein